MDEMERREHCECDPSQVVVDEGEGAEEDVAEEEDVVQEQEEEECSL